MNAITPKGHHEARAIIIAALIGLVGAITAGVLGNRAGERKSSDEVQNLESRMRQQESAIQALQAQVAEKEKAIHTLTDQVAQRPRVEPAHSVLRTGTETPAGGVGIPPEPNPPVQTSGTEREAPIAVQRLAPVDITLEKCEHWGGGLSCRLLLRNTGSAAALLALQDHSAFAYDERGNEYPMEQATLGSARWSAAQFGAIPVEPGIPLAARFQFVGVPESARRGPVRMQLAIVPVTGPPAFFGPNPHFKTIIFEDVPFQ